ncbi:MAG TPA: DedA family protein [Terriglobales bacterium]|jgi:membrane-associated protein|nr:DedA family protein [Terriglobales bacterium]
MNAHILQLLEGYFGRHGYWTVAVVLLLENAGVPVPGETVLLLAGFLTFSQHHFRLPWVIAVGVAAATFGDNLGYAIGCYGGRPLLNRYRQLFHISPAQIAQGERLFEKHGPVTVFFARFIFGMRIITGPLAGVLRMHWKKFALFNFLGAAAWVTVVAGAGYLFGRQWHSLVRWVGDVDILLGAIVALIIIAVVWRAGRSQTLLR